MPNEIKCNACGETIQVESFYEKYKDSIKKCSLAYYRRKREDPEWLEKHRQRAKEYYQKKRAKQTT